MNSFCFNRENRYKPAFAWPTPEGFHDERFLIPFEFTIAGNGQPFQGLSIPLDDDAPWIWRGLIWPQIAIWPESLLTGPRNVAAVRFRTAHGDSLSEGLVLSQGAWAMSGQGMLNAFGWGIAHEVVCDPGSSIYVDVQAGTNAGTAAVVHAFAGGTMEFDAGVFGTAGNGLAIALVDPAAPNIPLSVATGAGSVTVTLATDGGGVITSTLSQVAAGINTNAAARAILTAQVIAGSPSSLAAVFAGVLASGTASQAIILSGTLDGVKRRRICE